MHIKIKSIGYNFGTVGYLAAFALRSARQNRPHGRTIRTGTLKSLGVFAQTTDRHGRALASGRREKWSHWQAETVRLFSCTSIFPKHSHAQHNNSTQHTAQ